MPPQEALLTSAKRGGQGRGWWHGAERGGDGGGGIASVDRYASDEAGAALGVAR